MVQKWLLLRALFMGTHDTTDHRLYLWWCVLSCIPVWKIMLWCHNFAVFLFKLWLLYVKVTLGVHMIVVMMCFTWRILKLLYFCLLGSLGSLDYYFPLYITYCLSVSYLLAQFCMLKECGQFKYWINMIKCSKADTI